MRPTREAAATLSQDLVARVVELIRADPLLGRGSFSSWEEVTPTDYEAAERVRDLVDEGAVRVTGAPDALSLLQAFRAVEPGFWSNDA
jgi:hypothetical protein